MTMNHTAQATWTDDPNVAAQPENRPFWQAAEEGRLLGKACKACGRFHWIPRVVCPFCRSTDTHWLPLSGRGEVYACSTLRRADPPYTVAYVRLAEGPTLLTNLVDMAESQMHIGAAVQVVFRRTEDGRMAPKFSALPPDAGG
jgi:hypothetical protein